MTTLAKAAQIEQQILENTVENEALGYLIHEAQKLICRNEGVIADLNQEAQEMAQAMDPGTYPLSEEAREAQNEILKQEKNPPYANHNHKAGEEAAKALIHRIPARGLMDQAVQRAAARTPVGKVLKKHLRSPRKT